MTAAGWQYLVAGIGGGYSIIAVIMSFICIHINRRFP